MSDDREKLKALLLSEEIAQIQALQKLLDDKEALSKKLSEVLDPATDLTIAQNPNFQKKFSKIDSKSYVRAIKANKQTFIDALLPIIGPMIRKSVTAAIRRFVSDVNRAVEMGLSFKALKWRWKAFRTGIPFAEIVFNNTIEYQVQQVFLIDNHSGLLVAYAGHGEALLQDKDAMSAMLTAIQDFVKDSVNADGEGLSAAEIDDDILWITPGNKAKIAAIIKGAPTQRLRERMLAASEDIHIEFYQELESEHLWNNSPELDAELEKLLLTKSQSDEEQEKKGINFWPWLIILGGLLLWWAWSSYQHHQNRQELIGLLNKTPGFVLTKLRFENDQFIATGLQDPLAEIDTINNNLKLESTPFLSLEDSIIQKRLQNLLNDGKLQISVQDKVVKVEGTSHDQDVLNNQLNILKHQPGVAAVIDQVKYESSLTLDSFLKNNSIPSTLELNKNDDELIITGFTTLSTLQELEQKLQVFGKVNTRAVEVVTPAALKAHINASPLPIINPNSLNETHTQHLNKISKAFLQLKQLQNDVTIKLTAQSDCQGSLEESNEFSQKRMKLVHTYLLTKGIDNSTILTQVVECSSTAENIDKSKIGVWFEVIE